MTDMTDDFGKLLSNQGYGKKKDRFYVINLDYKNENEEVDNA